MLGRIGCGSGRKIEVNVEQIHALPVLTVGLPQHVQRPGRAVEKGADLLRRNGVRCVLTPPDFSWWPELSRSGLRSVKTCRLRCVLAPIWVEMQMERRNILRTEAVLCLKGERYDPVLEPLARELCPLVRGLVFDIPGGETAADHLRHEIGMPILPGDFNQVQLTLRLEDGPVLTGAKITLPGRELPADCDTTALISVLWETGRIKSEEIVLKL